MPDHDKEKYIGRPPEFKEPPPDEELLAILRKSKLRYHLRQELETYFFQDRWIRRQLEMIYWEVDRNSNKWDTLSPDRNEIKLGYELIRGLFVNLGSDWKKRIKAVKEHKMAFEK
ncbi:MAG: hypothetical protein AAB410_03920 [Patescibacteria group bacterium]